MAPAHEIITSILEHVAGSGRPDFDAWAIGLTHERPEACAAWSSRDALVSWEADSLAVAEVVEAFFIYEKGMQCVTDGALVPERTVHICLFPAA